MGDHRAEVKCEIELHGKTYKAHWDWINWDIHNGIDSCVVEFFEESSRDALNRYEEANWKAGEAARKEAQEKQERAELARLKAKYADQANTSTPAPADVNSKGGEQT